MYLFVVSIRDLHAATPLSSMAGWRSERSHFSEVRMEPQCSSFFYFIYILLSFAVAGFQARRSRELDG